MRLHFQETPWDLYGTIGFTAAMSTLILILGVGNPVAIVLVLVTPGYCLVAALFPRSARPDGSDVGWTERIALSFGLSLAIVPLLGLILNFTPWGIRFIPIVVTIALFTVGAGCAAYWRRMRLPADQRLSMSVDLAVPNWKDYSALDKGLTIVLSASVVVAGGSLAYVVLTPGPREPFTEFYILGPGGNASGYPAALNISQRGSLVVGIANHEFASVNYSVRVDLVGVRIIFDATLGFNQTIEVNRTTVSWLDATVPAGQSWTLPYTFRINATGLWQIQFLLFKGTDVSTAYREVHLFVRVV